MWCVSSCGSHWSVCEVVSVPYVGVVTVMYVLLFVLHVSMVRECEGDGNAGVWVVHVVQVLCVVQLTCKGLVGCMG